MKASRIATWALAGALSAMTIGGVAYSASADTGATTAAAPTPAAPGAKSAAKHPGGWPRNLEHGTFTTRVHKTNKTFDVQRGVVTAVSPTSITVRSTDGFDRTYTVNASTKVRQNGKPATIAQVGQNDRVQVLASSGTALNIQDRHPAATATAPKAG